MKRLSERGVRWLTDAPLAAEVSMLAQRSAAAEKAAKAATQNTAAPVEVVRSPIRTLFSRDYRSILFVNLLLTIGGMMPTSEFQRAQRRARVVHKEVQPHDMR